MTPAVLRLACATLLCAAPLSALADETRARLDRGDVLVDTRPVPGSGAPHVTVRAVIDAPPAKVWPLIDRCGDYPRTMQRIKEAKELSREGGQVRCEVLLASPWPMKDLRSVNAAEHTIEPGRWRRAWKLESGDFKVNDGSWTLTPFDQQGQRTYVVYEVHSEPKSGVPGFLQEFAVRQALPGLIQHLRAQMKEAKAESKGEPAGGRQAAAEGG